jgi:hypothetical protein
MNKAVMFLLIVYLAYLTIADNAIGNNTGSGSPGFNATTGNNETTVNTETTGNGTTGNNVTTVNTETTGNNVTTVNNVTTGNTETTGNNITTVNNVTTVNNATTGNTVTTGNNVTTVNNGTTVNTGTTGNTVTTGNNVTTTANYETTSNTTTVTNETVLTFTTTFDMGSWTLVISKISGTSPISFCTNTNLYLPRLTDPGDLASISSELLDSSTCDRKGETITLYITGTFTDNDTVSVEWNQTGLFAQDVNEGSNSLSFNSTMMTSVYSYNLTINTSALLQFILVPQAPYSTDAYLISVIDPFCNQVLGSTFVINPSSQSPSVESASINFCNANSGTYLIKIVPYEQPTGNDILNLYINNYATINYTTITSNTSMSFPYYQTTFLKYESPNNDTASSLFAFSTASNNTIGNTRFYLSAYGEGICTPEDSETLLLSFGVNSFSEEVGGCESGSPYYISVLPDQPVNGSATQTETIDITITDLAVPQSVSISLGTNYSSNNSTCYWTLPEASLDSMDTETVLVANLQGSQFSAEIYARRGAPLSPSMNCDNITTFSVYCNNSNSDNCTYSLAFPPCAFPESGDFYLVVTNTMNESLTLTVQALNVSTPDSKTDLIPNATLNGTVNPFGNSFIKYNNLTGPSLLQFTNTDPNNIIMVNSQNTKSISCYGRTHTVDTANSGYNILNLPLICHTSGFIYLETMSQDFVNFSASISPLEPISWTDNNCSVTNIPTAPGSTHLLTQFNTTSDNYLSFTINVDDNSVALRLVLYSQDNCTRIQKFLCQADSYPCVVSTSNSLPSGSYYLFIKDFVSIEDNNNVTSTNSVYNLTMNFSYGNAACRNITSQLQICAGYLSTDDYYNITSVSEYEYQVIYAYNLLSALWPFDCSQALWTYACRAIFQPSLCTSTTGNSSLTDTYYCSNDCIQNLQTQCLNGSAPNLCQRSSCMTVSELILECSGSNTNQTVPNTNQTVPSPTLPPTVNNNSTTQAPQGLNMTSVPTPANSTSANATFMSSTNNSQSIDFNSGNVMKISWFVGLLLIVVNWLVISQ